MRAAAVILVVGLAVFAEAANAERGSQPLVRLAPGYRSSSPVSSAPVWRGAPRAGHEMLTRPPSAPLALAYSDGRAVMGFKDPRTLDALASDYGLRRVTYDPKLNAAQVEADPTTIESLAASVASDPRLRYVEPAATLEVTHQRNDPLTYQVDPTTGVPWQWWFSKIGVDRGLNLSTGSSSFLVGVIDSGIVETPDLRGRVAEQWYSNSVASDAVDRIGHGTFVSSVIAANNDDGFGIAGACNGCRIVALKAMTDDGKISSFASAGAIRFIADRGIRVLNLSYGGSPGGPCSQVEYDALTYAIQQRGILVVAAAGNEGAGVISCPAALLQPDGGGPSAGLAVGASDYSDNRASFSNYGARVSMVAPGTYLGGGCSGIFASIPTGVGLGCTGTMNGATYSYASGTSFSSPMVAGVATLAWAARTDLSASQIADLMKRSTGAGQWSPDLGWGVLNAARALELATGRSSADPACSDGVDNDGDGRVDYPSDPGCSAASDPDEANAPPQPEDTHPPTVRALAGVYRPGSVAHLNYRVRDNSGETREVVKVYNSSNRVLKTVQTRFEDGADGSTFYVTWRVPRTVRGVLRHCVRSSDRAGNQSVWSCAPLRPR